ncbi:MAG TPA: SDR family oxidoreductase [Marmoricola sp.]|nr:SDR family oxidoreductase [Marmoricola sp.]
MNQLDGRLAVVTGGGSGLGAVMARRLVSEGVRVVLVGRRYDAVRAVADDLGEPARAEACDVSAPDDVTELARRLAGDDVSILVNNAGVGGPVAALPDITPEEWDEVFAINVRGTYLMCRALLPAMYERGAGDVVNVASVSGKRPLARRTPYCASKMAVIGLTSTLAHEAGPHGVRVNTLSPGPVESERMDRNFRLEAERTGSTVEEARRAFVERAALGRMVTPDEVADALVAMLTMPGLTGSDVDLSGGMIA